MKDRRTRAGRGLEMEKQGWRKDKKGLEKKE